MFHITWSGTISSPRLQADRHAFRRQSPFDRQNQVHTCLLLLGECGVQEWWQSCVRDPFPAIKLDLRQIITTSSKRQRWYMEYAQKS